jgi:hypothetical protein
MYTGAPTCPGETLLGNALNADQQGHFEIAYDFYERGVTYYLQIRMVNESNSSVHACIRQTCHEHINRMELLKLYIDVFKAAKQNIASAEDAYKRLDYSTSYPLFMVGIEKLLGAAQLIKPSHPHLTDCILREVATHMSLAEEIDKGLRSTCTSSPPCPPQSVPLLANQMMASNEAVTENIEPKLQMQHHELVNVGTLFSKSCSDDELSVPAPALEAVQYRAIQQADSTPLINMKSKDKFGKKKYSSSDVADIHELLLRQRIDAFLKESNLLLDYLQLNSENEQRLREMAQVSTHITNILEETNELGECIVKEYSAKRKQLETALQNCEDFLATPRSSTLTDKDLHNIDCNERQRIECLICFENLAVMATIPCGHKILCQDCVMDIADRLETCYVCKTELIAPKCIRIFD